MHNAGTGCGSHRQSFHLQIALSTNQYIKLVSLNGSVVPISARLERFCDRSDKSQTKNARCTAMASIYVGVEVGQRLSLRPSSSRGSAMLLMWSSRCRIVCYLHNEAFEQHPRQNFSKQVGTKCGIQGRDNTQDDVKVALRITIVTYIIED